MAEIATLPAPDKGELAQALKRQKREARTEARKEKLEKRDKLLEDIPELSEYQSMEIPHRKAVSHLPEGLEITPYSVFSLIWTTAVWEMLCDNTNLYASQQSTLSPT